MEGKPSEREETTPSEMRGWYMYDWANSPYFQVYVVGVFPVFVKWLAQAYAAGEEGWSEEQIFNCTVDPSRQQPSHITLPNLGITAGSFPVLIGWFTTVVQMLVLLTFSALGDYGPYRKTIMKILTWVASFCICINIACVTPTLYWLAGVLRIVAGGCFVMCVGFYNAYLPLLMESHPGPSRTSLRERIKLTDRASALGNLAGYAGGVLMLLLSFGLHYAFECDPCAQPAENRVAATDMETNQMQSSQIEANRIQGIKTEATELTVTPGHQCSSLDIFWVPALSISLVGLWWAGFSAYSFMTLKTRPGPPFPKNQRMLLMGWKDIAATARTVYQYKQTLLFVVVYFISSDALATLIGNAFLIADEVSTAQSGRWTTMTAMHINFILGAFAAFLGIFIYQFIQSKTGIKNKTMLTIQFVVMMCVAIACVSGGLDSIGFIHVMAPVSLTLGSMQSISRSIYTNLIPPGKEASMFAFYEITDKGSNLIGAAVTVIIHNWAHTYIHTMWYIMIGFGVSAVLLYFVDVEKGMEDLGKKPEEDGAEAQPDDKAPDDKKADSANIHVELGAQ